MDGHTLVPRGTPDPEGDRRFAERAFPLLEPLEWMGERHRGGYGVSQPGSVTNSLGLVFGPWDQFVSEPRLAVTVGDETLGLLFQEHTWFMLRSYLVADHDALLRDPRTEEKPPRFPTSVEIEGTPVDFLAAGTPERWVALGSWRTFAVFIHAIATRPDGIRLRVTEAIR
jgi:hypothetical protein